MTVQNTNRKDVYLTNGITIYWPYTFEIFTTDGSDLALYETNLTTGETVLIDTNLTRDIINSRIKYPRTGSPRPEGYKITVARITERTQGIDLETQSFDPKNMERGLDKLTAMVQEIDETVSRAAVADISQQGVNFTFPSPVGGKVVGWNAEGTGLINLDNTTLGIEAQMLAATEAAQDAADKVDNLVSTAFEPDGTTVKKATHADNANYKVIKNGFLSLSNASPTIVTLDSIIVPLGYILIAKVLPQTIAFPTGDTSKNIAKIASLGGSIWSHSDLVSYGRFLEEGVSFGRSYMSSGTYVNLQIEIYHHITLRLTYTDGTSGADENRFDVYYEIALIPAP